MSATLIQIITAARAKVANRWCQNRSTDTWGGVCAGYAIDRAVYDELGDIHVDNEEARQAQFDAWMTMRRAIGELFPDFGVAEQVSIPTWNDAYGRTKEEVLETFDRALKLAGKED